MASSSSTTSSPSDPPPPPPPPPPPWLDLPDFVTDLILERLPLVDYIRFAAVCPKWLSIQKAHRLHHSPAPPPMRQSLPWILPFAYHGEGPIFCFSMSSSSLHRLPPPSSSHSDFLFGSSHGWIFMSKDRRQCDSKTPIYLLNPISGRQIQLPSLSTPPNLRPSLGLLSASPSDPNCIALLKLPTNDPIFLCRPFENHWTRVKIPYHKTTTATHKFAYNCRSNVVFCRGKFYYLTSRFLTVIDPLFSAPSVQLLDMDCTELSKSRKLRHFLVECNKEVLLVVGKVLIRCAKKYDILTDFQVFKADFSERTWVRLKGCGDHVLFVGDRYSFSLSAAEVGFKSNCVCYTNENNAYKIGELPPAAWRLFDLETGLCSFGPTLPAELAKCGYTFFERWFLPSLC